MKTAEKRRDHCVLEENALVCRHCGARYRPALPCDITVYASILRAFATSHEDCKPPERNGSTA